MADFAARDEWADDDGDVCRVCRAEAEEGKPLIHPCKCSGSVRYVHGDCLQEWLSRNGKRYCEICQHHYTFSKVYPIALPSRIPTLVYARQSLMMAARFAWGILRICIAICSWLVVLPIIAMCCLRVIMYLADNLSYASVAYGIRNAIVDSHAELNRTFILPNTTLANGTASNVTITGRERVLNMVAQNSTAGILPSLTDKMAADVRNLVAFVFRGQIVAVSVATGLIGLVLLREWITQLEWHARPPMEPEGEVVLSHWAFRNGQAIRLTDPTGLNDAESNHADAGAGYDSAESGRVAAGAEQDGDGSTAVGDLDEEDPSSNSDEAARHVRPIPAHVQSRAFVAPELLEEGIDERGSNAEAGPSSRPMADVPEDVPAQPLKPLFGGQAWDPSAFGRGAGDSNSAAEEKTGEDRPNENDYSAEDQDSAHPSVPDAEDRKNDDENGSDEAERSWEGGEDQPAWKPQHLVNGTDDPPDHAEGTSATAMPQIPPPPVPQWNNDEERLRNNAVMEAYYNAHVEELRAEQSRHEEAGDGELEETPSNHQRGGQLRADDQLQAPSPGTDSPETPGSHASGVFSDAGDDEENLERAVAAIVEQYRERTERQELNPQELVNGRPRDEEDAEEHPDNGAEGPEAVAAEGPDPGWEFVDNMDGFVVDAEFVERVMAVNNNNVDVAGMEIPVEDDDDRPLDADDWDGILGVIGFIGPLTDLLHNHIFVSFAMAFALSVLVGLPVILGKIVLATDFIRATRDLYIINMRAISLLSNLILTVVGWILREVLVLPRMVVKTLAKYILETAGVEGSFQDVDYVGSALNFSSYFSSRPYSQDALKPIQYAVELPVVGPAADKVLDGLELIGRSAHEVYKAYRLKAISIAASSDSSDQVLCMVVGYATMSFSVLAIAVADAANLLNLSPHIMEKSRNLQMFLKVVFFMSLEIVCFPIFIGFAMDASTLALFGATLADRLARLSHRPFGSIFVLWASGTVFMISFAAFLTHMKKKGCRPGALYFIRDPSDPSHSPVKEIMDRPALAQLPRLAVSASMYLVVVFSVCGAVPCTLWALGKVTTLWQGFLPLRMEQRPLSSVPFDLLFLHLVLPPSWEGLDMYRRFKKAFLTWWTYVVSTVDLSSLIFGIQSRARPQGKWAQTAWIVGDAVCQFIFGRYDNRATRARVPNNDRVELMSLSERRRENVFIPLDHRGSPKSDADKLRLLRQDRIARHAGRNPRTDYTTILLPEHWRTRIYALLGMILLSAAALVTVIFVVPLIIGRQAAGFLMKGPIYDGYSWLAGVYVSLGSFAVGQSVRRHIVELNRADRLRRSTKSARIKRSLFSLSRGIFAIVMLYVVLPLLVGINFELFVSLPVRYGFSTDLTPVLHLWDAWATGAALLSLYVGAVGMAVEDQVQVPRGNRLRAVFKKPLRQKFSTLTSTLLPPIAWLLLVIILPWLLLSGIWTGMQLIGAPLPPLDLTFRMTFPMSWIILLVMMSWRAIQATIARLRQWMIDAEYVVAERVENYEPDGPTPIELIPGATYEVLDGEVEAAEHSDGEGEGEWEDVAAE